MVTDAVPSSERDGDVAAPAQRRRGRRDLLDRWTDSYALDDVVAASSPEGTILAVLAQGGFLAVLGYVPWLQARVQLPRPWFPVALTLIAGALTLGSYRLKAQGPVGFALTMLDNTFYSTALVVAAVQATPRWGLALAVIHGMMVLGFPSRVYGLTVPFAVAMGIPLVIGFSVATPSAVVTTVLLATYAMVLIQSQYTLSRLRIERRQAQLQEAVATTGRLADESTQLAFSQLSLGIGHFVHELRNAQAAQQLYLQVLLADDSLSEEAREVLQDIVQAQSHEEELIAEVLDGLRSHGRAPVEPFEVAACIERFAGTEAEVELDLEDGGVWVTSSRQNLEVALTNLVRNARQAGAEAVHVRLRCPAEGAAEIVVCDDGPGLSADRAQGAFEAFAESTKPTGTGLGLYLTRRYVELLGGRIELSTPGPLGGACFRIVLPTCPAPSK